jgi:predicted Na+-dependent transporter
VSILFTAAPHILALIGSGTLIAFATFMLVGLAVGHWLGGPEAEDRTALAYSSASRHPGIAIAMAHANFPQQTLAMAAVLLYLLINTAVSLLYHVWTKRCRAAVVSAEVPSIRIAATPDEEAPELAHTRGSLRRGVARGIATLLTNNGMSGL